MQRIIFSVILVFAFMGDVSMSTAAEWRLMDRHGGCRTLAEAAKRKSEFEGVTGPIDFAAKMRRLGETVTVLERGAGDGQTVSVDVPGRKLSVIFAGGALCRKR